MQRGTGSSKGVVFLAWGMGSLAIASGCTDDFSRFQFDASSGRPRDASAANMSDSTQNAANNRVSGAGEAGRQNARDGRSHAGAGGDATGLDAGASSSATPRQQDRGEPSGTGRGPASDMDAGAAM